MAQFPGWRPSTRNEDLEQKIPRVEDSLTDPISDKPAVCTQGLIRYRPLRGYSERSACMGSMEAARSAGTQQARSAMAASNGGTSAKVSASWG